MLHELHVQNFALIDSLRLQFYPGLNLLSGETGSGKSILIDALGLALGGRALGEQVRTGSDRATVTAVFRSAGQPPWLIWQEEMGIAGEADGELILRREIQSGGRSRLLVNDQPVTLNAARPLARLLVDVHGQNEHVALLASVAQRNLLDEAAGAGELLTRVAACYERRRALEQEIESLSRDDQERLRAIDLLRYQMEELERAALKPGEDLQLEDERRVLMNVEKVRAAASAAFAALYEDEESASSRLGSAERHWEELARFAPEAAAYQEPLASARAAIEDAALFLRSYLNKLEADPARLEEIESRLALIDRMKRKYGKTTEEILEYAARTREQLNKLEHSGERRAALAPELEAAKADYRRAAEELSKKRRETAKALEKRVREELAQLGMEKTLFAIHFEPIRSEGGPGGIDEIEMRIAPNPGEPLHALEKVASGGELSRLMLALKTVVAGMRGNERRNGKMGSRTLVFDEVDAGIGGRVAECVGQRLKRLAQGAQVLCVTHLPQIACFADHHFYVEKTTRAGRTLTSIKRLEDSGERTAELARMLSGSHITSAVLEHAASMLKHARE